MNPRVIGIALAALVLLAGAWAAIVRLSWREDATAVSAAGSAEGDGRAAPAGSREPSAQAAGTAVAPTPGAKASAGGAATAVPADRAAAAPGGDARLGSAEGAEPESHDGPPAPATGQGAAGAAAAPPAGTRYPADLAGLQRAIGSVVPEMRECYAAWRKQRPGLGGAMRVHMTIASGAESKDQAHVVRAEIVDDQLKHPAVAGCVQNALDELSFEPPAEGKLEVTLPLQFAGEGETPEPKGADKSRGAKPALAASRTKEQAP